MVLILFDFNRQKNTNYQIEMKIIVRWGMSANNIFLYLSHIVKNKVYIYRSEYYRQNGVLAHPELQTSLIGGTLLTKR